MQPLDLPTVAISVRQPWAFAIIHLGKDIENRSGAAIIRGGMAAHKGNRIAIHASKGMNRDEYEDGRRYIERLGLVCPPPADLLRGGIIGSVFIERVVRNHRDAASPWWMGPRGLKLRDPVPCEFVPTVGALGAFTWATVAGGPDAPALWMTNWGQEKPTRPGKAPATFPLLDGGAR